MERKTFKFELKSIDEMDGTFEGIASAFRKTPDKAKDIVRPGAFKKTVSENPVVPGTYMHDIDQIVSKMELMETDRGLMVKGQIIKGIQKAEETLLLMKAGLIKTLSIGYDVVQREFKDGIRYLTELKVLEVAHVVGSFACDDEAIITSVKTDHKAASFEENYQWNMLRASGGRMLDTLFQTIDDIMYDSQADKTSEVDAAITSFHTMFMDWIGQAVDAGMIKVDKTEFQTKAQAIKDNFQALLKTTKVETEPGNPTPETEEDREAALLENVLGGIKAEVGGFDAREAERRLDEILAEFKL